MAFYLGAPLRAVQPSLAYVFWHWPREGASRGGYETKLAAFIQSLSVHPPRGLVDASSFRVGGLPWPPVASAVYEDWYIVKGYQSLGRLNDAAVDPSNRRAHRLVANESGGGAGGLYRLVGGRVRPREARFATWLSRPPETTYETFLEGLLEMELRSGLWQRQLVFGPAPEFCLHTEGRPSLPATQRGITVEVVPISPTGASER